MDNLLNRASHTKIISIKDKNGNVLDIDSCLKNWENIAKTVQDFSKIILKYRLEEIIPFLYDEEGKMKNGQPHGLGRPLQADSRNIDGKTNSRYITDFTSLKCYSRVDDMIRANVITAARGTANRRDTWNSIIESKLYGKKSIKNSAGWSRTVVPNPSTPGKVLTLSQPSNLYCKVKYRDEKTITYDVVCGKEWVELKVFIPKHLRDSIKIIQPTLVWNSKTNDFSIILTGKKEKKKYKISNKYVIGVDVGICNYVTYAVYDKEKDICVENGTLSSYLDNELWLSIHKTQEQIKNCWLKIIEVKSEDNINCFGYYPDWVHKEIDRLYADICDQRKALSRKRKEMALQSALELKNLSLKYDNALVSRENLSWVGNTMQNGRWNCGEFFHRLQDVLENVGGESMWVNAWYTSQTCSQCDNMHKKTITNPEKEYQFTVNDDRSVSCDKCGYIGDRDVNAAINIAKRAVRSPLFKRKVSSSSAYPVQDNEKVFKRGSSKKWYRDKQKKKKMAHSPRDKCSPTPSRKEQENKRKLDIVDQVKLPVKFYASSDREVRKSCFNQLYPSIFNGLVGLSVDSGVKLVLSFEESNKIREKTRKVLKE